MNDAEFLTNHPNTMATGLQVVASCLVVVPFPWVAWQRVIGRGISLLPGLLH